ncbi:MAG: tyrosine-protein phosphatase [Bacilli bacterium]|nr:tyrosine-protein phosphatase [Bacilli bacterium]
MARRIVFNNVENFRDLGGYPCDFGTTSFGYVYRSASLARADRGDLDKMAEIGIKSVIDLRGKRDQESDPNPCAADSRFEVYHLEVNGNGRIPQNQEDQYDSYFEMIVDAESARKIFRTFISAKKPMVFHCNAGKDRTGVFTLILLSLAGVHIDDINADYMLSFPYLPKMTKETREIRKYVPELVLTPRTEFIPEFYRRFLERFGSAREYLEAIGLREDEIDYLANILGVHEKSCGAVVFHKGKVLVEHMAKGHYSVPKGHVEPYDKDDYDTARREIKEETGLDVSFIDGYQYDINYSPRTGRVKRVSFFLAEAKSTDTTVQKEEVSDIYFLTPTDALHTLTHESDRKLVSDAATFYIKNAK